MKLMDEEIDYIGLQYLYNAIQTPDGTILESIHVHDYKEYVDTVTGELYINDGGLHYRRRTINTTPSKDLSVKIDADIEEIREVFRWGTYGKNNDEVFKRVLLKDMSNLHLWNIIQDVLLILCHLINQIILNTQVTQMTTFILTMMHYLMAGYYEI